MRTFKPHVIITRRDGRIDKCEVYDPDQEGVVVDLPITNVEYDQGPSNPGTVKLSIHSMRVRFVEEDS